MRWFSVAFVIALGLPLVFATAMTKVAQRQAEESARELAAIEIDHRQYLDRRGRTTQADLQLETMNQARQAWIEKKRVDMAARKAQQRQEHAEREARELAAARAKKAKALADWLKSPSTDANKVAGRACWQRALERVTKLEPFYVANLSWLMTELIEEQHPGAYNALALISPGKRTVKSDCSWFFDWVYLHHGGKDYWRLQALDTWQ